MNKRFEKRKGLSLKRLFKMRNQEGQVFVEFALFVPVLVLLGLVFMDFGRAYFANQVVLNAAREGARIGILPSSSEADVTTTVGTLMTQGGLAGQQTVSFSNVGTTVPSGATTTVTVAINFQTLTGTFVPGWTGTIPISQTIRMRHE